MVFRRRAVKRRKLSTPRKRYIKKRSTGTRRTYRKRSYSKGIRQWLMSPDTPRARVATSSLASLPLPLHKDPPKLPDGAIPFTDGSKGYWIPNPIPFGKRKGQYGLTNDQIDTINDLGLAAGAVIGTTIGAWVIPEVLGLAAGAALADVGILASIESAALRVGAQTVARGANYLKNARAGAYNFGTELKEVSSFLPKYPNGRIPDIRNYPIPDFRNLPNVIQNLRLQNFAKRIPEPLKSYTAKEWNSQALKSYTAKQWNRQPYYNEYGTPLLSTNTFPTI